MKKALITGITGQDGSYLARFLVEKGYAVHGILRRSSVDNTIRLHDLRNQITLHYGDLSDSGSIFHLIHAMQPDEIYNLAAQSDVAVSFSTAEYTANINALGTLRLLEAIRVLKVDCRFYQASTSELYGNTLETPQNETTPFWPRSPYATAKLYAYWITVNYRDAYGLFASNGILFNHESPDRGENFVTRKITRALGRIVLGLQRCLYLGNLHAFRDWGHTRDFVEMQWRILQQENPDDFVIATGEHYSVQDFVTRAARTLGVSLRWEGTGLLERGIVDRVNTTYETPLRAGMEIVKVDPALFRPAEVPTLLGDATKAWNKLNWRPKVTFQQLVEEMAWSDYHLALKERQEKCTSASMPA